MQGREIKKPKEYFRKVKLTKKLITIEYRPGGDKKPG